MVISVYTDTRKSTWIKRSNRKKRKIFLEENKMSKILEEIENDSITQEIDSI